MSNGKALLKQTALAAACTFCLIVWGAGHGAAAQLEATDSGAPSAKVMFPVTEKAAPTAASMKPVVFNHLIHEKAIERCEDCHHTGEPQACTDCHTVEGKKDGNYITLEKAMHATDIAKRAKGETPSSCVSCHEQQLAQRECAGCHSVVKPAKDAEWCNVCHSANPSIEELAKGVTGKLSCDENLDLATREVLGKKPVPAPAGLGPMKATIDTLAKEYAPNVFNHRRHFTSVAERIKDNQLAGAFHSKPETLCSTCHHNSPLSVTPPKCSSCHSKTIDPMQPERPALKAAYHLQCMGCHTGMTVHRPVNTDCTACHKALPEPEETAQEAGAEAK